MIGAALAACVPACRSHGGMLLTAGTARKAAEGGRERLFALCPHSFTDSRVADLERSCEEFRCVPLQLCRCAGVPHGLL